MPSDPFSPKTKAILDAERELGLDVQTHNPGLGAIISVDDLRDRRKHTQRFTKAVWY